MGGNLVTSKQVSFGAKFTSRSVFLRLLGWMFTLIKLVKQRHVYILHGVGITLAADSTRPKIPSLSKHGARRDNKLGPHVTDSKNKYVMVNLL